MSTGVTRRSAMAAAAALVVGGVAGLVYGRNSDAANGTSSGPTYGSGSSSGTGSGSGNAARNKPLARVAAIPVGGGVIGSGVVVTRQSNDAVRAFSSRCTHLGCTVSNVSNGKIFCPCHGSVFNADTGAVIQGPATRPLPPVRVSVRNGGVYPA